MRRLLMVVVLAGCVRAPAYQPPDVRLSPAYGAVTSASTARGGEMREGEARLSERPSPDGAPSAPSARFTSEVEPWVRSASCGRCALEPMIGWRYSKRSGLWASQMCMSLN